MPLENLLNRSDIPRDVKETIKKGIDYLKLLEGKMEESEQHYRAIINAITDPIHVVDRNLRLLLLNEAIKIWLKKLDLETDLLDKLLYEAFPFLPDKIRDEYQQVFTTGESLITAEVNNLAGEEVFTEVIKIPLFEDGEVKRVITIIRDITKYKKVEETLRESEEKYRTLFDTSPEAIAIVNLDGVILDCNKTAAKMAGVPKDQIIGKSYLALNFLKEEDFSIYIGYLSRIIDGVEVKPFEMEITLRGSKAWIEIFSALLKKNNEVQAIQIIARDITDRKEAENTLRESEKRFTSFMRNLPGIAFIKDSDHRYVFANRYFEEEFQLNHEEWYGKINEELFPADVAAQFTKIDQQVLTQTSTLEQEQVSIQDGVKKNWLTYKFPIRLKDSTFVGGIGIDVTERKQTENRTLKLAHDLGERVKELKCLYGAVRLKDSDKPMDAVFQEILKLIPLGWQSPEIACARLLLEDKEFTTGNFQETPWKLATDIKVLNKKIGELQIYYFEERLINKEEPFTKEERELIEALGKELGEFVRSKQIEEYLRFQAQLIENVSDAVISTDLNFNIKSWNKAAELIYGWSENEVLDKPLTEVTQIKLPYNRREDTINQLFREGSWKGEVLQSRKDGKRLNILTSVSLIENSTGEPVGVVATNYDITARKKAEKKLRESEARYRSLVDTSPDAITLTDLEGKILMVNQQALKGYGCETAEEMIGQNALDFIVPEDRSRALENLGKTLELGQVTNIEYTLLKKDGSSYPAELSASVILDANKRPKAFIGLTRDISQRKQAEKELQEAKEKYQMLVEKLHEGVLLEDTQGFISFVNPRVIEMLGYNEEELMGRHWSTIVPTEETNKIKKESAKRPQGISSTYEGRLLAKDGRCVPVIISATSLFTDTGSFQGVLSVFIDITERKRMEEVLQQSEEKYRNLVERANDGIAIVQDKQIKYINPALAKMTGYTAEELYDTLFMRYVHLKDLPRVVKHYDHRMKGQNAPNIYEARITKKGGIIIDIEVNAGMISYWGKPADLVIIRDITERKRVEKEIKRAHSDLNQIFNAVVPLCVIDSNYNILRINDTFSSFFHIKKEELIGKKCYEIWQGTLCDTLECPLKQILKGKEQVEYEADRVLDGNIKISFIVTAVPYRGPDGEIIGIIENFTDITERKHTEEALRESEEALRQVKLQEERYHTMLGHFLKNDLHEIINNLEYFTLADQFDQGLNETVVDRVMDISFRSSRTIDTVNTIFTVLQTPFGQRQESLNLLEIIQEAVSELRLSVAFSHPIIINEKSTDIKIISDQYLKNVFSEILLFIVNPTKGEVIIETEQRALHFCVSIQDQHSRPIPKEVCTRLAGTITDKWESQGHFIGISLASVIMQHYGGQLTIDPSEHHGNKFQLLFPLHLIQTKK
ncbi:MAG: PAS domain S-box protein [Candidatus Hermodarchaeota archaeon]